MERFSENEIAYLNDQLLGRVATTGPDGQPHVTPVGFRIDAERGTIEFGGYDLTNTRKLRDLRANPRVAFVVDDLESVSPWRPRGILIRGTAEIDERGGQTRPGFGDVVVRINPERVISWGLTAPVASGQTVT